MEIFIYLSFQNISKIYHRFLRNHSNLEVDLIGVYTSKMNSHRELKRNSNDTMLTLTANIEL